MPRAIALRRDFSAGELRRLARRNKDAAQARRLLALTAQELFQLDLEPYDITAVEAVRNHQQDAARIDGHALHMHDGRVERQVQGRGRLYIGRPHREDLARIDDTHTTDIREQLQRGLATQIQR